MARKKVEDDDGIEEERVEGYMPTKLERRLGPRLTAGQAEDALRLRRQDGQSRTRTTTTIPADSKSQASDNRSRIPRRATGNLHKGVDNSAAANGGAQTPTYGVDMLRSAFQCKGCVGAVVGPILVVLQGLRSETPNSPSSSWGVDACIGQH
ncbi:hypothetical protein PHSY_003613 [Pseudozyma hubeiensis SY62]|uniref:Uncharacterized protein n=1 Tax=Pseudozyma hubeiensis (strain SY62) TaxID=1305764 RepID=R9P408_PSEHS|nr:hypothetical protein PHSY_003613 [Pseudozyma hubeiensis SY62]GAC96034.1 hypothetical protein PHSY_003613 [Pseudozyma hubeiensis SY62]